MSGAIVGLVPPPDAVVHDPLPAAPSTAPVPSPWLTEVRRAYVDQAALGYVMYLLGAISAFLAGALALSDSEAGLHSTAMATGLIASGLASHRLDARFGLRAVHLAALAVMAGAVVVIAWAPTFAVTLTGSLAMGAGVGLVLSHVNAAVSAIGGARAVVQFIRATLVSMLTSASVAVVVGLGVAIGPGWQAAIIPALLFIGIASLASRGRSRQPREVSATHDRLPRAFWLPWLLTVLVVCVEFGVLFWAATMVERTTGASLADATLTISVFFGGVVLARALVSGIPALGRTSPIRLLRVSLGLAFVGVLAVWASTSYELSVVAMLVGGLGLGVLYPVSASVSLATAPDARALASGRVVLASGAAMLLAPFVLGVAADAVGVVTAWLLIPVLCVVSLLVTVPVARVRS
jgi:MFS family permease